jgi:hypothetical protein
MNARKVFILMAAAFGWAGCATPEARIQRRPEIFARLTLAEQETIRKGGVNVGFDQEMVKLGLGEPDRVHSRTDARGTTDVWIYATYDRSDGLPLYRGWYHRYYGWGDPLYPYYLDYPARRTHEYLRVAFDVSGKVSSIEKDQRDRY